MNSLPASAVQVAGITLTQSEVTGVAQVPATVSLNGRAQGSGFPVVVQSTNPSIQVPGFVTVAAGSASAPFTVQASAVLIAQAGTIRVSGNGSSAAATLQLDPANGPTIANVTLNPAMVAGGGTVTGTVSLNAFAPGGAEIQLSSNNAAAQTPATVTIGLGQTSANFPITTSEVTGPVTATITAKIGGSSQSVQLEINPPVALALSAASVVGGNNVTGTVTLASPAPVGGVTVRLQSSDFSAQVPALGVVVTGGQTMATLNVQTIAVSVAHTATITASYGGNASSAILTVNPPGAVTLESLSVSPSTVMGGSPVTGTVTVTGVAPPTGITVLLSSSSPFAQLAQSFVTIPSGMSAASFTIGTLAPPSTQMVTITAAYQSVKQTATLTIQ